MENVVELNLNDKRVWLVGTAHVSTKSVELVEETIEKVKPDVVAVELCKQRRDALLDEKKWESTEIDEVIKSGRTYVFMAQILLANYQRKIGDSLGIMPGAEMLAAIKAAEKTGARVGLVDRDVKLTLQRTAGKMGFWEKLRLLSDVLSGVVEKDEVDEELVEKLKKKDILTEFIDELAKDAPSIKEVLVDERDAFIAGKISDIKAEKIVAIVGAGHVEGIKKILEDNSKVDLDALSEVSKKKSKLKYFAYLIPLVFLFIIGWGFLKHGGGVTVEMLARWFIVNGTLSAIGVALALGHPATILAAFVAAPFTSLNPMIAAGWFAGLVELKLRKPRVIDFKNLLKLSGISDYWRNRVTRTLLVIAFANLGSSLGTFIAFPYIASLI